MISRRYRWHGTGPRSTLGKVQPGGDVDLSDAAAARIRGVHGRDDVLELLGSEQPEPVVETQHTASPEAMFISGSPFMGHAKARGLAARLDAEFADRFDGDSQTEKARACIASAVASDPSGVYATYLEMVKG